MFKARYAALLMPVALTACASEKIVGRYHTAQCRTGEDQAQPCNAITATAAAFVTSIALPPTAPAAPSAKSGLGFSDRALAAYITALSSARFSKDAKSLQAALAAKLGPSGDGSSSGLQDATLFHRNVIVSIRKTGGYNPADRLVSATATVRLPAGWKFVSWGSLATTYTTINAGTLQLTQTRGVTGGANLAAPAGSPVTAGLTGTVSSTNAMVENLNATERKEDVSVTIEDGALVLYREGGFGVDLTGNVVISADIQYKARDDQYLRLFTADWKDKNGAWIAPDKIKLVRSVTRAIPEGEAARGITAQVHLNYTMRHIEQGDDTYPDRDDDVTNITSTTDTASDLMTSADITTGSFGVRNSEGFFVQQQGNASDVAGVCFATYLEAEDFLAYLHSSAFKGSKLGAARIGFSVDPTKPLLPINAAQVDTFRAAPQCL